MLERLTYGLLVLVLVTVIVTTIINLSPVDPARLTFGQRLDEATVALKRQRLGLDEPLHMQVLYTLRDFSPFVAGSPKTWRAEYTGHNAQFGDLLIGIKWPYLRESYHSGRPVRELLFEAFPNTLILSLCAIGLAIVLGICLGILAAIYKDSWLDRLVILMSSLGYSVPSYVTAIVLGVLFGYYFRSVTGLNIQGSLMELDDFGEEVMVWKNLVLPAIALGIRPVSIVAQLMRSSMLDVINEKFVLAARAKGLSSIQVIKDHVLKNALNPVVTALSGWFAALLAGAFFVEFIFNFKGLGFVTVNALLNYDIPVVLGALLFTSSLFIMINILVDVTYAFLDPRIKLGE